eukprot:1147222-Pelagomonas_calceolata.AAC.2
MCLKLLKPFHDEGWRMAFLPLGAWGSCQVSNLLLSCACTHAHACTLMHACAHWDGNHRTGKGCNERSLRRMTCKAFAAAPAAPAAAAVAAATAHTAWAA